MSDELAALLGKRFIERRDVKAVQYPDGHYEPHLADRKNTDSERIGFTMSDLRAHLAGTATYGHYLISPEGNCRVICFDVDLASKGTLVDPEGAEHGDIPLRDYWRAKPNDAHGKKQLITELRCAAEALALRAKRLLECPVAVTYSGSKGMHAYAFIGSTPSIDARAAALAVIESFDGYEAFRGVNFFRATEGFKNVEIEAYPKQDNLDGKDLGNLLRLPLGVHRKTGSPGFFVDLCQPYDVLVETDPLPILTDGAEW